MLKNKNGVLDDAIRENKPTWPWCNVRGLYLNTVLWYMSVCQMLHQVGTVCLTTQINVSIIEWAAQDNVNKKIPHHKMKGCSSQSKRVKVCTAVRYGLPPEVQTRILINNSYTTPTCSGLCTAWLLNSKQQNYTHMHIEISCCIAPVWKLS